MTLPWSELPSVMDGGRLKRIIAENLWSRAKLDGVSFGEDRIHGLNVTAMTRATEIMQRLPVIQEPISFSTFVRVRENYLRAAFVSYCERKDRPVQRSYEYKKWLETSFYSDYLRNSLLDAAGLLMKKEFDLLIKEENKGEAKDRSKILEGVTRKLYPTRASVSVTGDKFLPNVERAADLMALERLDGKRVVVAMGAFDGPTAGHTEFFEHLNQIVGVYGRVFALLASDEEIRIFKQQEPIFPLDRRLKSVAIMNAVDYVAPIALPEYVSDTETKRRFYEDLHLLAHFRAIGEMDDRFDIFREACMKAYMGLLIDDEPRITSTSDLRNRMR